VQKLGNNPTIRPQRLADLGNNPKRG